MGDLPDPRRRQGTRYPLSAVLSLVLAALACQQLSVLAIAEWGAAQPLTVLRALGLLHGRTPHVTTLYRLRRRLDPTMLAAAMLPVDAPTADPPPPARGTQGVAIDGTSHRGCLPHAPVRAHPVPAASLVAHDTSEILAQVPVDVHAQQSDLGVATDLLTRIAWPGRVLTGHALYCQHTSAPRFSRRVVIMCW